MRILVISNYTNSPPRETILLRRLRDILGTEPVVVGNRELGSLTDDGFDALIVSGSNASYGLPEGIEDYRSELEFVGRFEGPVFGICFGHQLLATAFGGQVSRMQSRTNGFREIQIAVRDPLFNGLPGRIVVCEAHARMVEVVPSCFNVLAYSEEGRVEAIRHVDKPLYGVQFHPERCSAKYPDGLRVMQNFFDQMRSDGYT